MAYIQNVNLNVSGMPRDNSTTIIQISQNENGRRFTVRITGVTIPEGSTATISGVKPDGVLYSAEAEVSGNNVIITEDLQMSAKAGIWYAKVRVINYGNVIATEKVRIEVDSDAVSEDCVPSSSELEGLVAEAAAYAEAAKRAAHVEEIEAQIDAVNDSVTAQGNRITILQRDLSDADVELDEKITAEHDRIDTLNGAYEGFNDLLENTPYTTAVEDQTFELPIHTIRDDQISDDSTWSSKHIIDMIYPVGSIFMSVSNTNPSAYLGGTWETWAAGRVPVGYYFRDNRFNEAEKYGGEYEHTLTIAEMPSHRHSVEYETPASGGDGSKIWADAGGDGRYTGYEGGGQPHNIMQPYMVCYMWKRVK